MYLFSGVVTTELRNGEGQGRISYENRGECFFLPYTKDDVEGNVTLRVGDTVSFQMTTSQRYDNSVFVGGMGGLEKRERVKMIDYL